MGNLCCSDTDQTKLTQKNQKPLGSAVEEPVLDASAVRKIIEDAGHPHIFQEWENLNEEQKKILIEQCNSFDPAEVNGLYENLVKNESNSQAAMNEIEAFDEQAVVKKADLSPVDRQKYSDVGNHLIKEGKVCVVMLAGGQGSRLGFSGPKGMYCVDGLKERSIFQFLIERFYRVQMNAHGHKHVVGQPLPKELLKCKMMIMTSKDNHADTVKFIAEDNNYFGGDASMFEFFIQATIPAIDLDGKILMSSNHEIKLSPNGNGGFFNSIAKIDKIRRHIEEMEFVQVIGVDNIMNKIMDPLQVGYTKENQLLASMKSCPKVNSGEKVGVAAKKDGKYAIVEYSELSKENAESVLADGKTLKFRHGSILIFMFDAKYLLEVATSKEANSLYHRAFKKVEYFDFKTKESTKPEKENAWKFELFIQNFMGLVPDGKFGLLEVERKFEFGPIKNADCEPPVDCPASARALLLAESEQWTENAGLMVLDGKYFFSPLYSYEGEGCNQDGLKEPNLIKVE